MSKQTYTLSYLDSHGFKHEHPIYAWCDKHAVDQAYNFVETHEGVIDPGLTDTSGKILLPSDQIWW